MKSFKEFLTEQVEIDEAKQPTWEVGYGKLSVKVKAPNYGNALRKADRVWEKEHGNKQNPGSASRSGKKVFANKI